MELRQLYDTTIAGDGVTSAFRLVVLPTRSLAPEFRMVLRSEAAHLWGPFAPPLDLGFDGPGLIFSQRDVGHEPSSFMWLLPYMLCASAYFEDIEGAIAYVEDVKYGRRKDPPGHDSRLLTLAEKIVDEPIVPFEHSEVAGTSLKDIISTGSGVGIGAYLGFLAAGGTPLVFLTVPMGMILCGGAVGFSKALERGVYVKALKLMGVQEGIGAQGRGGGA